MAAKGKVAAKYKRKIEANKSRLGDFAIATCRDAGRAILLGIASAASPAPAPPPPPNEQLHSGSGMVQTQPHLADLFCSHLKLSLKLFHPLRLSKNGFLHLRHVLANSSIFPQQQFRLRMCWPRLRQRNTQI